VQRTKVRSSSTQRCIFSVLLVRGTQPVDLTLTSDRRPRHCISGLLADRTYRTCFLFQHNEFYLWSFENVHACEADSSIVPGSHSVRISTGICVFWGFYRPPFCPLHWSKMLSLKGTLLPLCSIHELIIFPSVPFFLWRDSLFRALASSFEV
jgi:hypothetical protein